MTFNVFLLNAFVFSKIYLLTSCFTRFLCKLIKVPPAPPRPRCILNGDKFYHLYSRYRVALTLYSFNCVANDPHTYNTKN